MKVQVRLTDKCPPDFRKRLTYNTRQMTASDSGELELSTNEALVLVKAGFAEEVTASSQMRRGRPPKIAAQEPEPDPQSAELEVPEPTHAELMARAEELGVELPSGYVRKDELAKIVAEAEKSEDGDS